MSLGEVKILTKRELSTIRACLRQRINEERNYRRHLRTESFWGDDDICQAASRRAEKRAQDVLNKLKMI